MKVVHIASTWWILILSSFIPSNVLGFAATPPTPSLQSLLTTHQSDIAKLKDIASTISSDEAVAPKDDVFYLRYVLNDDYDDDDGRIAALKSNIEWRNTDGKTIVTSARNAIQSATASSDGWDNALIQSSAPNSNLIFNYLSPINVMTTSLPSTNVLVYCIRAGKIDDNGLMNAVTIDQMVDFFIYCKEVNSAVADMRSIETNSLLKLITCNDLCGVKLTGGSKTFRKALSEASKHANTLYPSLNGRTLMLNLPSLLGALVKLFTPLLPKAVTARLKFAKGPLSNVEDLREIAVGGKGRDKFVNEVDSLAYGD